MAEILDINVIVNKLRSIDILLNNSIMNQKTKFLIQHAKENWINITDSNIEDSPRSKYEMTVSSDESIDLPRVFKNHANNKKPSKLKDKDKHDCPEEEETKKSKARPTFNVSGIWMNLSKNIQKPPTITKMSLEDMTEEQQAEFIMNVISRSRKANKISINSKYKGKTQKQKEEMAAIFIQRWYRLRKEEKRRRRANRMLRVNQER